MDKKGTHILATKPSGQISHDRLTSGWEDKIKMDLNYSDGDNTAVGSIGLTRHFLINTELLKEDHLP
jgi:hypothetical protein